jgi:hypothetical protein
MEGIIFSDTVFKLYANKTSRFIGAL